MPAGTVRFRHFILGLLMQQPMSGYDIKRFLKNLDWLIGSPSFGSLYPALHALLEDGLVTVETQPRQGKPPKKLYSITEAGQRVFQAWIEQPVALRPSLKPFIRRLILAGNVSEERLDADLKNRRAQVAEHWAALMEAKELSSFSTELGPNLVLDYGLALASAELEWLDSTLSQLSDVSPQSLPLEVAESKSIP
jgi:DNA-binding PadR family transcriptional regulator